MTGRVPIVSSLYCIEDFIEGLFHKNDVRAIAPYDNHLKSLFELYDEEKLKLAEILRQENEENDAEMLFGQRQEKQADEIETKKLKSAINKGSNKAGNVNFATNVNIRLFY